MSLSTSIRLSNDELIRLERAALCSGKNRNKLIREAIKEYLDRHEYDLIAAEIRRQSLLIAANEAPEDMEFYDPAIFEEDES
jgi:predicted transcriptional regulator